MKPVTMRRRRINAAVALVNEEELEGQYHTALKYLIEKFGKADLGHYLEFGVCHGTSTLCMYGQLEHFGLDNVKLFGFDSFDGLPADVEGVWAEGAFNSDFEYTKQTLSQAGIDWSRVVLTKGWFSDTLKAAFLAQHNIKKASIIMVDCDMYSSAKEALEFCVPVILDQSIVIFDDWNPLAKQNKGEKRAFEEFLDDNPQFTAEGFGEYSYMDNDLNGKVFIISRQ